MVLVQSQSSLSRVLSTQSQLARLEKQVGEARRELATGRLADVGLALGVRTGDAIALRQELTRIESTTDTNRLVSTRLEATQSSLRTVSTGASDFLEALVAARGNASTREIIGQQAKDALWRVVEALGTQVAGVNLFSGINVDRNPLEAYFADPAPPSRNAVGAAFSAHFGFSQSDPAVATISASSMQTYMDTTFEGLFSDSSWQANWSAAGEPSTSIVTGGVVLTSSVTANEGSIRNVMRALVLIADSGTAQLNTPAYDAVVDEAIRLVGEGMAGLADLEGQVGTMQSRVSDASEGLESRRVLLTRTLGQMEDVDPTELSTRLSELLNQIEAAYTITARLQRISLLDEI